VQLSRDDVLSKIASALSYVPKKAWQGFRANVEEIEVHKLKLKLKEQIQPRWQTSGEELFDAIAKCPETVVFLLDEFAVMIDEISHMDARHEDARLLLRWLRQLRQIAAHQERPVSGGRLDRHRERAQQSRGERVHERLRASEAAAIFRSMADRFLQALSESHDVPLSAAVRKKVMDLIGARVPYFVQIMFSEIAKASKERGIAPTPAAVQALYRDTILGVDCKTYFDHYYGRLRDYYDKQHERAAKTILRTIARLGSVKRDACYQIYRKECDGADIERFNGLMSNIESDYYVVFNARQNAYEFSCKLLRDWWLRHYGMDS